MKNYIKIRVSLDKFITIMGIVGKRRNESKRDNFVRIAEQRVNTILDQFRKLGNLSNVRNYDYNEKDIKKIFQILTGELKNVRKKFDTKKSMKGKFKL